MRQSDEWVLFENIKRGDLLSFETLFHQFYGQLCSYSEKFTQNSDSAEEIVQDFFVRLWEKREQLNIESSVKHYFFRSVKNQSLNFIQHQKIREKHNVSIISEHQTIDLIDETFVEIDLTKKIEESISSLPEKRREIFRLSREEGLKYKEIAVKMNISVKTVETQMSLAIKHLRSKLIDYLTLLMMFLNLF